MHTTKGSKAYGMISYAKYIFPPLPVMIEKLIFDRACTGLHVVTNMSIPSLTYSDHVTAISLISICTRELSRLSHITLDFAK